MSYKSAQEAVAESLAQWQASIARSDSFALRRAYAELYALALVGLARESLRSAKCPGSVAFNDRTTASR